MNLKRLSFASKDEREVATKAAQREVDAAFAIVEERQEALRSARENLGKKKSFLARVVGAQVRAAEEPSA